MKSRMFFVAAGLSTLALSLSPVVSMAEETCFAYAHVLIPTGKRDPDVVVLDVIEIPVAGNRSVDGWGKPSWANGAAVAAGAEALVTNSLKPARTPFTGRAYCESKQYVEILRNADLKGAATQVHGSWIKGVSTPGTAAAAGKKPSAASKESLPVLHRTATPKNDTAARFAAAEARSKVEQGKADSAQEKRTAEAMAQLAKRKAAAKTGGDVIDK